MVGEVVTAVVGAGIIGAGGLLFRAVFLLRPKVRVSYARGNGSSGPGGSWSDLRITWWYSLTLENLSKNDALELHLLTAAPGVFQKVPANHIEGLKSVKYEGKLEKLVERQIVVAAAHDFYGRLQPPELQHFELLFSYKNDSGVRFYTRYVKDGDTQTNSYSLRRPRHAAS